MTPQQLKSMLLSRTAGINVLIGTPDWPDGGFDYPTHHFGWIRPEESLGAFSALSSSGFQVNLNVGAGAAPETHGAAPEAPDGWFFHDLRPFPTIHLCCEMLELERWLPEGCVARIFNADVIEHFPFREVGEVLKSWHDLLNIGGTLEVVTPDLGMVARELDEGRMDWITAQKYLYGNQTSFVNFHKSLFDLNTLVSFLSQAGFVRVQQLPNLGRHLRVIAEK